MVSECEIPSSVITANFSYSQKMIPSRSGVYCIFCDANNKYYVGGSGNMRARFNGHRAALRHSRHKNPQIFSAYKKYGEGSFFFRPLEFCQKDNIIERESYWMNELDSVGSGFNIREDAAGRPGKPSDKLLLYSRALANRKNLKKFSFISPSGEVFSGVNLSKFCREMGLPVSNMQILAQGVVISCRGWKTVDVREKKSNAWALQKPYHLISPDGIEYKGENLSKFAREMGLTGTSLTQVILGNQKNHKGWRKAPCL